MTTAILGVGKIGNAVATNLVAGGGEVILAAQRTEPAEQLAANLNLGVFSAFAHLGGFG